MQNKILENVEPLGHDWADAVYEWSEDYCEVTATRTCKNDSEHIEVETVETIWSITKSPTNDTMGETTYSSSEFNNPAFAMQFLIAPDIPALKDLSVLMLPADLKSIGDEAFMHLPCEAIIVPKGCTTIGSRAFAGCNNLVYVRIPSSVVSIADDAFEDCNTVKIDRSDYIE